MPSTAEMHDHYRALTERYEATLKQLLHLGEAPGEMNREEIRRELARVVRSALFPTEGRSDD